MLYNQANTTAKTDIDTISRHTTRLDHFDSIVGGSSTHYDNSTQPSSISSASQDDLSIFDKSSPALRPRSSMDQLKTALAGNKAFPFRLKHKKSSEMLSVPPASISRVRSEGDETRIPAPEPPKATLNISTRQDDQMEDNIFAGMARRSSLVMDGGGRGAAVLPLPPAARTVCDIIDGVVDEVSADILY